MQVYQPSMSSKQIQKRKNDFICDVGCYKSVLIVCTSVPSRYLQLIYSNFRFIERGLFNNNNVTFWILTQIKVLKKITKREEVIA